MLIRAITRRTGRGWPTILLGLAIDLIEEGLLTGSAVVTVAVVIVALRRPRVGQPRPPRPVLTYARVG